eukprot:6038376-Amphidinium_carterae.1
MVCEKGEHVKIYNDPQLRRRKTYLSLVEKLHECNLVDFIPACEVVCRVCVFCVHKKDGRQRLILDCAAKGFRKVCPLSSRPPLPWELAASIAV